jgi:hypothetical protein
MAHQLNFLSFKRTSKLSQKGAALLLLVFLLLLISITVFINSTTGIEFKAKRDIKTASVLKEAKAALLGWSVIQNNPGQLPCPEDTTLIGHPTEEGQAKLSCTLPAIGRLPWRTLGLGDIRDGNNDMLWYVISNGFSSSPINVNTAAQLSVNGVPNSAVAIIFSPGVPLATQSRPTPTSSSPPVISQYLDLQNNINGTTLFVNKGSANDLIDRLMVISKNDLFSLVEKRILREVRGDVTQGLVKFYSTNGFYPYADINNDGVADNLQNSGTASYKGLSDMNSLYFLPNIESTLSNNGWYPLVNYTVSPDRQSVLLTLDTQSIVVTP